MKVLLQSFYIDLRALSDRRLHVLPRTLHQVGSDRREIQVSHSLGLRWSMKGGGKR